MTLMTPQNIDIHARKLYLEVFLWFWGRGERSRRMETGWRPGFYTEFRCASREHSEMGAVFEKIPKIKTYTLFENVQT